MSIVRPIPELVMSKKIGLIVAPLALHLMIRAEEFVTRVILMRQLTLMLTKISFSWKEAAGLPETLSLRFNLGASSLLELISWIVLKNQNLG